MKSICATHGNYSPSDSVPNYLAAQWAINANQPADAGMSAATKFAMASFWSRMEDKCTGWGSDLYQ